MLYHTLPTTTKFKVSLHPSSNVCYSLVTKAGKWMRIVLHSSFLGLKMATNSPQRLLAIWKNVYWSDKNAKDWCVYIWQSFSMNPECWVINNSKQISTWYQTQCQIVVIGGQPLVEIMPYLVVSIQSVYPFQPIRDVIRDCSEVTSRDQDDWGGADLVKMMASCPQLPKSERGIEMWLNIGENAMYSTYHIEMNKGMFYDNVITIIHDVNLNVKDDEKITLLLTDHRIMKNTGNFIIKCMERRC